MSGKAQFALFEDQGLVGSDLGPRLTSNPLKTQFLKWVGNKQRFARDIVSLFPASFNSYFDPFLGSGAVLATLAPRGGFGSDSFKPLVEIWRALKYQPETLVQWYAERYSRFVSGEGIEKYERIKASYNMGPNGAISYSSAALATVGLSDFARLTDICQRLAVSIDLFRLHGLPRELPSGGGE